MNPLNRYLMIVVGIFNLSAEAIAKSDVHCPDLKIKSSSYESAHQLLDQGLVHLAFQQWDRLLSNPNEPAQAKQAAALCASSIEIAHPRLKLSKSAVDGLLNSPARARSRAAFLTFLARGQLRPQDYPKEFAARADDGAALRLIFALKQTASNPTPAALTLLLPAIHGSKALPFPVLYSKLLDLADLTAARLLYTADRYPEALEKTKSILKKFPSQPEAYELKAWIEFAMKKNKEGVIDSISLGTPAFKNYFSPQTRLIPARIYLKNCAYSQVKQQLGYFRIKYKKENEYLAKKDRDYYQDFLTSLNKYIGVSSKVMARWLSSPSTLALLDERNLLIDEEGILAEQPDARVRATLQALEVNQARDTKNHFATLATLLHQELDEAVQNAALLQVDQMLGVSQGMNGADANRKPAQAPAPAQSRSKLATWSWGTKDTSRMEDEELWSDEISNLNVDVQNRCKE